MDSLNSSSGNITMAYRIVGKHEKAIQYLQPSYKNREGTLVYIINVEPLYKPLRDDIRFQKLVQAMGLQLSQIKVISIPWLLFRHSRQAF